MQLQHGEIGQCIHCSEKLCPACPSQCYYVGGRLSNGASWGVCFSHLSEILEGEWQALSDVGRLAF